MIDKYSEIDEDWVNFVSDYVDSKIDDAANKGLEQGLEQAYLKMIFKGMDPRLIGCSEELFWELHEKARQMNN